MHKISNKTLAGVCLVLLTPALLAGPPADQPRLAHPQPGAHSLPAYVPVSLATLNPSELLRRQTRWIRDRVWTSGEVADAATFLFPQSYDVTSGYGFLGTDFFSWMLEHNDAYFQYDLTHNSHLLNVPLDHSNDAVMERVMMAGGGSSYDMASWSIALAAAARNRHFSAAEKADFTSALAAYGKFLISASYPGGFTSYKACDPTGAQPWHYGESGQDPSQGVDAAGRPRDARNAFYWQYPSPRWEHPDPHWDPQARPQAVMAWPGWEVVTGEQAWVAFLAPMQVAYLQGGGRAGWSRIEAPLSAPALLDLGCRALAAVELMQNSVTGALYRNVRPPDKPEEPRWFAASTENNWSMATGLHFLERALLDRLATPDPAAPVPDFDPDQALATVRRIQVGLTRFFGDRARVWHAKGEPFPDPAAVSHGFFLQGTAGKAGAATGNRDGFAPDVQTWGIAAILGDRRLYQALEPVYGPGFLDDMFNAAVELAGFTEPQAGGGRVLAGIGFNSQRPGDPAAQMSGEWTWGAINAAIVLADFHREKAHADPARVAELLDQARALIAGANRHCSHDYNPARLTSGRDWVATLYANARQWIPWGWYSNPCPSQAATTWAMRVNAGFDCFELGGGSHADSVRALGLAGGQE